ncbi:bifunctional GNAT family N-acetyltransferase/hotdog fold thioesterase [Alteromonas oceanisediminis]|uniref:bifunctional GNAT family N-acetyltransferase/hotdog fold thioesterase n=1 Tax=Alteromonas oceanisediminis TaxID=2836180 RepID=UPI001BDABEEC|nr:bifunctional GNAT family N-acetyltransferase/thioesterase [Alteromonas oceanisediminis]MBT0587699.1 YiiD C-terminal domain-containing protein [Alteromonas oceanisediminis]
MFKITTPATDEQFQAYFQFRWEVLRKPWNYPPGSEKDEYETVSEHRMLLDEEGNIVACGRVHLNTSEEAQVRHIAVSAEHQRQGLGQMIVSALEDVARSLGAERAITNSRETSIAFFQSCGFEVEAEAPNELNSLKRSQMVKPLTDNNVLMRHPKWCQELQSIWHDTIPISDHMGIKIYRYTGRTFETRASLNKNINIHGTMFAGSIFSLATLTGWGIIHLMLKEQGLLGDIVLGDGDIHYHKPITRQPRAICIVDAITGSVDNLRRNKKAVLKLQVDILDNDTPVAEFKGVFWVLPVNAK